MKRFSNLFLVSLLSNTTLGAYKLFDTNGYFSNKKTPTTTAANSYIKGLNSEFRFYREAAEKRYILNTLK
jgi:hypothetical protein